MKRALAHLPGLTAAVAVAGAAALLAAFLGGSALLYAVVIGMLLHSPFDRNAFTPGLNVASDNLLRVGVALLGLRISLEQVLALGATPLLLALVGIPATLLVGVAAARLLGMTKSEGVLSGGAVAICGSSAAIALAAVLPQRKSIEHQLVFVIIGVTALSTLAMIAYPLVVSLLGYSEIERGLFLGGSIHNVPQAVAAGYSVSPAAGDAATLIKLLRVALLAPVVLLVSLIVARQGHVSNGKALLPGFLVAFVVLVIVNSLGWLPEALRAFLELLSQALLLVAIAAIGVKASARDLVALGWRPLMLLTLETLFLAGLVLAGLILLH